MDRLQAIETFVAVASLGSFAAAARHLRVSPAADLNAYDLLCQKRLLITRDALDRLRKQESK